MVYIFHSFLRGSSLSLSTGQTGITYPLHLSIERTHYWLHLLLVIFGVGRENKHRARHGLRGKFPSLEPWSTYLLWWKTIIMLKMKQTMQCWQCSWERDKGFEKVMKYFSKRPLCLWQQRQKRGNSGGSTLELGNNSSLLNSSVWKGHITIDSISANHLRCEACACLLFLS